MKYQKWQFLILPNKGLMKWKNPILQCVYMWICSFTDEDWVCFPSIRLIADCAWCSERSVDKYLKELTTLGVLVKVNRFRENEKISNEYQMMIIDSTGSAPVALGSAGDAPEGSATGAHRTKPTSLTKSIKDMQPPTLEELQLYFKENGYRNDTATKAYKFYSSANWHDSNWKKVLNRKQKMQSVWFKDENKLILSKMQEIDREYEKTRPLWFTS